MWLCTVLPIYAAFQPSSCLHPLPLLPAPPPPPPPCSEFVAHGLTEDEICEVLGADGLIYQSMEDLIDCGRELNPSLREFDDSCFTGGWVEGGGGRGVR